METIAGGKTPGLCLEEALPAEVVALGISICDTTRDGSRIVGYSCLTALWKGCPSLGNNPEKSSRRSRGRSLQRCSPKGGIGRCISHWRARNTGSHGPRSRPQSGLFLKEAFGKVQLGSLRFCVLAQSQKLTVIGLGLRTSTRKFCGSSATEETVEPIRGKLHGSFIGCQGLLGLVLLQ